MGQQEDYRWVNGGILARYSQRNDDGSEGHYGHFSPQDPSFGYVLWCPIVSRQWINVPVSVHEESNKQNHVEMPDHNPTNSLRCSDREDGKQGGIELGWNCKQR